MSAAERRERAAGDTRRRIRNARAAQTTRRNTSLRRDATGAAASRAQPAVPFFARCACWVRTLWCA